MRMGKTRLVVEPRVHASIKNRKERSAAYLAAKNALLRAGFMHRYEFALTAKAEAEAQAKKMRKVTDKLGSGVIVMRPCEMTPLSLW